MTMVAEITGLEEVMARLNAEIEKIEGRTKAGLWEAALMVRREAQKLCPVDTGNLKASAYTLAYQTPEGPGAEVGFTASYAAAVHEINANYTVGEWKFLETALKKLESEIPKVIASRAEAA